MLYQLPGDLAVRRDKEVLGHLLRIRTIIDQATHPPIRNG